MTKQLVIQLARFGDIVQTKRLLLSLQRTGEVHLCVDRSLEALARLVYPDIPLWGVAAHGCEASFVFRECASTLNALGQERFDAVYILNHVGLSRALAAFFDPAIVRGYPVASGQVLRSNWMRLAFRWMTRRREAPLNLVDFWAALAPDRIPPCEVNPVAVSGGQGLGVVLAGQHARRSLPPEILAPVVHGAFERLGGPTVRLLGGPTEIPMARRLLACLPRAVVERTQNLTGRTDWNGLVNALAGLDLLLSPDTGTIHLAVHLGIPVEGLYCSSAWALETGPYGAGHRVWQALASCSPCTETAPCGRDAVCRQAFLAPPFLARMQGRESGAAGRPLTDMALLASGFDDMGLVWRTADGSCSPCGSGQRILRALLGEYCGGNADALLSGIRTDGAQHSCRPSDGEEPRKEGDSPFASCADFLYHEADWMLPQAKP